MFNFIKRYLERLAEENKKTFGSGKLDCCDLNKSQKVNVQSQKKN
jgi:hypothetical protein